MAGEMLTVADLVKKWRMPERRVREIVLTEGVPRLELGRKGKNISWRGVRFLPESIADWERSNLAVSVAAAAAKPTVPAAPPAAAARRAPRKRLAILDL